MKEILKIIAYPFVGLIQIFGVILALFYIFISSPFGCVFIYADETMPFWCKCCFIPGNVVWVGLMVCGLGRVGREVMEEK